MMKKTRRVFAVICTLSVVAIIISIGVGAASRRGPVIISETTTHLTEPIGLDGRIDYPAALNRRASEGVTHENNALVPLLDLSSGDGTIPFTEITRKALSLPKRKPTTPDFIPFREIDFASRIRAEHPEWDEEDVDLEVKRAFQKAYELSEHPWTAEEFPEVERWLRANEPCLPAIREASQRDRWYAPHLTLSLQKEVLPLSNCVTISVQIIPAIGQFLTTRAMWNIGREKPREAIRDLLTLARLGGIIGRDAHTSYDHSIASGRSQAVRKMALQWVEGDHLSAEDWMTLRKGLRELPEHRSLAEIYDHAERWTVLEQVERLSTVSKRNWSEVLAFCLGEKPDRVLDGNWAILFRSTQFLGADWNRILRETNLLIDDYVEAAREESFQIRQRKMSQVVKAHHNRFRNSVTRPVLRDLATSFAPREKLTSILSESCTQLSVGFSNSEGSRRRDLVGRCLLDVAISLKLHAIRTGSYPKTLDQLGKAVITDSETEVMFGGTLEYERTETGFHLWTTGPEGLSDIGVRIPQPNVDEFGFEILRAPEED